MKLILLEKVANLGGVGDVVKVKPGYGRNFLMPYGKAIPANDVNIKQFEERRADLEAKAKDTLAAAQKRREDVEKLNITIAVKSSEEGKLFGSLSTRDIAKAVTDAGVASEKAEVLMPEGPIRNTGEYEIGMQLHSDVTATVKVVVVSAKD